MRKFFLLIGLLLLGYTVSGGLQHRLEIQPNPVIGDTIHLVVDREQVKILQVEVFNLGGRCLIRIKEPNSAVDVSVLPSGYYIVRVKLDSDTTIMRNILKT